MRNLIELCQIQKKKVCYLLHWQYCSEQQLIANSIRQVNAQGNATNGTGAGGVLTITKIDVDSLNECAKGKYPKLAVTGTEDRDLIGTLKELKDAKEAAKTIIAANIMRDLIQYKALQDL